MERLQKFLSAAGVASRRKAEELIRQGKVTVNGERAVLGARIQPHRDIVRVEGKIVTPEKKVYLILFKPRGVVTTRRDPQGRMTVMDLIGNTGATIHPVGRLDYDTEGLLLLTNDGDLTYKLTHPRFNINKTYRVLVAGRPTEQALKLLRRGLLLEDGWTAPARVNVLERRNEKTWVEMTIHEGRNRQVRRMWAELGYPVLQLRRTKFAFLTLGQLKPGEYRYLSRAEVKQLRALVEGKR